MMQETIHETEEAASKFAAEFNKAHPESLAFIEQNKNRVRMFGREPTMEALKSKLRCAYDVAVKHDLKRIVQVLDIKRNDPCPCGSGRKFKKCCLWKCQ